MDTSRDESSAEVKLFLDGNRVGQGTCRFNKVGGKVTSSLFGGSSPPPFCVIMLLYCVLYIRGNDLIFLNCTYIFIL